MKQWVKPITLDIEETRVLPGRNGEMFIMVKATSWDPIVVGPKSSSDLRITCTPLRHRKEDEGSHFEAFFQISIAASQNP